VKRFIAALALGVSALVSTAATAGNGYGYGYGGGSDYGSGFYIGANAGEIFYKEQGLGTMVPSVAFVQIGQQFNPYLAIEGRLGGGVNGDQYQYFHVDVPLVYGGYVKGMLPLSPWFSVYGLVGAGGVQLHRNYPDYSSNDISLSGGVGGEFTFYNGISLHAEWVRLDSGNNDGYGFTADQLAVGVSWHL
jgi:hypothetical protein